MQSLNRWRSIRGSRILRFGAAGRCTERGFLEYHHLIPYADNGATAAENLELRCRAHLAYEAERWFGVSEEDLVREARASYSVWTELDERTVLAGVSRTA